MIIEKIKKQRGFTLIELLVVISIIALLSAVVLAALGTTRTKGKNAAVQDGVIELRNQIELGYNSSTGTYSDLLPNLNTSDASVAIATSFGASMAAIASGLLAQNNMSSSTNYGGGIVGGAGCGPVYGVTDGSSYSLYESLNGLTIFVDTANCVLAKKYAIYAAYGPTIGSSGYYCVDSTGASISKTSGFIPQVNTPICQ